MNIKKALFCLAIAGLFASAGRADCTLSDSILRPYRTGSVTLHNRRAMGAAVERLFTQCPTGPADHASRARFFELVSRLYQIGDDAAQRGSSETAWESQHQFENELSQYMDRIVNEHDVEFKTIILKTGSGLAISKLGQSAQYDVLRMSHVADPLVIGAGHHSAYAQSLAALGYWIDPAETRFTAAEKNEMTQLLLSELRNSAGKPLVGAPYVVAHAAVVALSHSDSPEAATALRAFAADKRSSLGEDAQRSYKVIEARMQR